MRCQGSVGVCYVARTKFRSSPFLREVQGRSRYSSKPDVRSNWNFKNGGNTIPGTWQYAGASTRMNVQQYELGIT